MRREPRGAGLGLVAGFSLPVVSWSGLVGTSGGGGSTEPPLCETTADGVAPAPMRRLTRFEYNNTVADLLGVSTRPADAFPPDVESRGFDNNADLLGISP